MTEVVCTSRIARVDVYARGAMVTRTVTPAEALPEDAVVLRVPGLTALAEPGSVRAEVGGGREVVSLRTRLVVPDAGDEDGMPGPILERLRDLELARQALDAERAHLEWRRAALAQRELKTGLASKGRFVDPAGRTADALAVGGLFAALASEVDRRLADVVQALVGNAREREAAELEASQARSGDRKRAGQPTIEVAVGLSAGQALVELAVVYAVGAARWWPTYAVRLGASAARAEWTLAAFVAQATGEDWSAVRLGLSTADLVHSARLPSLPSLRIGRMQPPPRTGYRAAPADLDALFEGWDRAAVDLGFAPPPLAGPTGDTITRTILPRLEIGAVDHREATPFPSPSPAARGMGTPIPPPSARPAPTPLPAMGAPARLPPEALASLAEDEEEESTAGGMVVSDQPMSFMARAPAAAVARPQAPPPAAVVVDRAIEPADTWLDFDTLRLAAPEDRALRGRLVRELPERRGQREEALASIETLASPGMARDPLETRGRFDARWDAEGTADVPSDTRPHRVSVGSGGGAGRTQLRTVPRETPEVFRQAWLDNPFDVPLLAGPVDVFVEGALVTTAPIEAVDRGGTVRLGLGVEERVRVARNVTVDEASAGLLGGSTAVQHVVTIDVRSSLGHPVQVEVIDRVPVGGDPDVEVAHSSRPEGKSYDQSERGRPVKGGLLWVLDLPPAGEARVELRYRVKIPGSSELVGGNRRE